MNVTVSALEAFVRAARTLPQEDVYDVVEGYIRISVEGAEVFQLLSGEKRPGSEVRPPALPGGEKGGRGLPPHLALREDSRAACGVPPRGVRAVRGVTGSVGVTAHVPHVSLALPALRRERRSGPTRAGPPCSPVGTLESVSVGSTSYW